MCDSCINEHRKREGDFLLNVKPEGGDWGSMCVLTIRCCSACLDANIQLGLLAQRHWKAEAVETCKPRVTFSSAQVYFFLFLQMLCWKRKCRNL
jgi:hypothetical protein